MKPQSLKDWGTRRRFLNISALAGLSGVTVAALRNRRDNQPLDDYPAWSWNGVLFGADASINLHGIESEAIARQLTETCFLEMRRLERIFSLFIPESVISQLNREGRRGNCPPEFLDLIAEARRLHELTRGAFDVTVQPLWEAFDRHDFQSGPISDEVIAQGLAKVGSQHVRIDGETVSFAKPGMAITFNGIAQGFITDRITELLKKHGVQHALINMGEYRAVGQHGAGRAWELGIRPPGSEEVATVIDSVPMRDRALAVSGGYGYTFDAEGHRHHLLHPHTGNNLSADRSIAVTAANATLADAVSTACAVLNDKTALALCSDLQCDLRIYRGSDRNA